MFKKSPFNKYTVSNDDLYIHDYSILFKKNIMNKQIIERLSSEINIIQYIVVKYKQENNIMNQKIPIQDYQTYVNSLNIELKYNDQRFYDVLHDYLIQIDYNVKNSYETTSAIFSNPEGYVTPTMAAVERNYGNEFLIRMVIQKRNELKVHIKTSYSLSIKEVSWKYPSFINV